MKKNILYVAISIFLIIVINYIFQMNAGASLLANEKNDKNYISGGFSKQQGDCIVYIEPNTLSFGDNIYLYSVKDDERYLLERGWGPFGKFDDNISILDDKLFFVKWFRWNPESEVNIKSLKLGKEKSYYIGDEYLYKDGFLYGIDYDGVFYVNTVTEETNYIIDFKNYKSEDSLIFYDHLKLIDDWIITNIYSDDISLDKMIFYNIKTEEKIALNLNDFGIKSEMIEAFTVIESKKFVFKYTNSKEVDRGFLGEFDLETEELNIIDIPYKKSRKPYVDSQCMMEMKDKKLYYSDIYGDINIYDYKTGKSKTLIEISKELNAIEEEYEVESINVYFCDNYICIDVNYVQIYSNTHTFARKLFVFNYDGSLYKAKRLNSYTKG